MNCWAKSNFSRGILHVKGYMFNFFFWLDLLCVLSMIPDIKWASELFGIDDIVAAGVGAKAGKAGKIGAKTGRVVRMARLIRLVKLYKITSQRKREKKILEDLGKLVELGHINQQDIDLYLEKMTSSQKQSLQYLGIQSKKIINSNLYKHISAKKKFLYLIHGTQKVNFMINLINYPNGK